MSVNGETWVDGDGNGDCDPGEGIEYVIDVQNVGTVTLGDTTLSDDLLGDFVDCGVFSQGGYLAPNTSMTCTGTYQVGRRTVDKESAAWESLFGFAKYGITCAASPTDRLGMRSS